MRATNATRERSFSTMKQIKAFQMAQKQPLAGVQHRCFPVNIPKFLRTAFFIEH